MTGAGTAREAGPASFILRQLLSCRPDGHERRSQSHAQAEVRGPPEPDVTASHPADAHAPGEAEPVAADSGADVTAWDIYREINDILRHLHL